MPRVNGWRHAGRLFAYLVAAIAVFFPRESLSEDQLIDRFDLRYAVVLENGDPVTGTVSCKFGKNCSLTAVGPVKIDILLAKRADGLHASDALVINCEGSCSFASGRSRIPLSGQRRFVFFDSVDPGGVGVPLVYRRKEKLGEIFIIYPQSDDQAVPGEFDTP